MIEPSILLPLTGSNRVVVISTVAQLNGEIYLDRFLRFPDCVTDVKSVQVVLRL